MIRLFLVPLFLKQVVLLKSIDFKTSHYVSAFTATLK